MAAAVFVLVDVGAANGAVAGCGETETETESEPKPDLANELACSLPAAELNSEPTRWPAAALGGVLAVLLLAGLFIPPPVSCICEFTRLESPS